MKNKNFRLEKDSMGSMKVPKDALYGSQTQRAVENFPISNIPFYQSSINAIVIIKRSAAKSNYKLGHLDKKRMEAITKASHEVGALCGFDLAHAAGNVPLSLHDWDVDFACWCTYKYMNSGPGSVGGVFIHEKHHNSNLPRLEGWWGHDKESRFKMDPDYLSIGTAESWQMSNAPVFNMAIHKVSLDIFIEAGGMEVLRERSLRLTDYLEQTIGIVAETTGTNLEILTPCDHEQRGCQLSVVAHGQERGLYKKLSANGVVVDWREPSVIRMAPVPLYNSFEDIARFGLILQDSLS